VASAALAAFLLLGSSASAETEVGQGCRAEGVEPNRTLLVFNSSGFPVIQPVTPEEPPQVITAWTIGVAAGLAPLPQRLEVYRVLNEAQDYRKEAESATETVRAGLNSFPTRIPVNWTGYLGLYGPGGTFACDAHGSGQPAGYFEGSAGVGETRSVATKTDIGVPLRVTIEPDLDRDGYGDETQDGCPQSAALQSECPAVQPTVSSAKATKRAVMLEVAINAPAQVEVFGQIGWATPRKAGGERKVTTGISAGAPRRVNSPAVVTFRLQLGKAVLRRLDDLTPRQLLRARITIRTTDLAGRQKERDLTVRLRGRAKA